MKSWSWLIVICAGALVGVLACNPPADYALVGSAFVPSAHGDIEVEKIDKQQILVSVVIDHLPPPERVESGMTHYVMWFSEVGALPVRQQALEYDPEKQVASASVPTSLRDFDVQITAERSDTPIQPSDVLVASQKIREN